MTTSTFKTYSGGGVASHSKHFEGLGSTSPAGRRYGNEFRMNSVTVDEGVNNTITFEKEKVLHYVNSYLPKDSEQAPSPELLSSRCSQSNSTLSPRRGRKVAFTLAEVLITLGIIGIVAALTLPTLIAEYQKHVWVNQLYQTKSILENTTRAIMADALEDNYFHATGIKAICHGSYTDGSCSYTRGAQQEHEINVLNKYLKLNICAEDDQGVLRNKYPKCNSYKYKRFNLNSSSPSTSNSLPYTLPSGAQFGLIMPVTYGYNTKKCPGGKDYSSQVLVDVNGYTKGPNRIGRDIFAFWIRSDGIWIPQGSAEYAKCQTGDSSDAALSTTYYWKSATETSNNGCDSNLSKYTGTGYGCTGRVFEEGKMSY